MDKSNEEHNDCHDCGESHWYNFMVPEEVWKQIAPEKYSPGLGGMLCVRCTDKRCAKLGIKTEGQFFFKGEAVTVRPPDTKAEAIIGT